jgi:gallate dioxygenase
MSYVFDLERSAQGLRLNRFLHGLTRRELRDLFENDPDQAMQELSAEERDMVRRLDWRAMQDHGANFFCLEKLGRVKGVSNPEIVAHFRGESLDEFLRTRRVPGAR